LVAPDLRGLPPALIVTAGCDPLRDEAEAYVMRPEEAAVRAKSACYEDMIHAFLFFFTSSTSRKKALENASATLRQALA